MINGMKAPETFKYCLLLQLVSGFPSSGINKDGSNWSKSRQSSVFRTKKKNDKLTRSGLWLSCTQGELSPVAAA